MAEYTVVYQKEHKNEFIPDAPAALQKSRILFDSGNDRMVIQFQLLNVSEAPIEKVFMRVCLFDSEGKNIKTVEEHIILSDAKWGESFGENSPLFEDDKNVARCEAVMEKAVLGSGRIWINEGGTVETAAPVKNISLPPKEFEYLKNLAARNGVSLKCMFEEHDNYKRCSCGMILNSSAKQCPVCRVRVETLRRCFSGEGLEEEKKRSRNLKCIAAGVAAVILAVSLYSARMVYLGSGEFPEFNEKGIAFGVDSKGMGVCINRLGFTVQKYDDRGYDPGSGWWLSVNGKWGLINDKADWVIEPFCDEVPHFKGDNAWAVVEGKYGLIDGTGSFLINPEYDKPGDFSEGGTAWLSSDGKWRLVNTSGEIVSDTVLEQCPEYNEMGLASVMTGMNFMYIDREGNCVSGPFSMATILLDKEEEITAVKVGEKYGIIDKYGQYISEPQFDKIYKFPEGSNTARVEINGKYRYINKNGEYISSNAFDEAYDFYYGLARVRVDGKFRFINTTGEFISSHEFIEAGDFEVSDYEPEYNSYTAIVKENGKYGVINKKGVYILEPVIVTDKIDNVSVYFYYDSINSGNVKVYTKEGYRSIFFENGKITEEFDIKN